MRDVEFGGAVFGRLRQTLAVGPATLVAATASYAGGTEEVGSHGTVENVGLAIAMLIAVWALGLSLLFALGFILSKLTLRSAERTDPNIALSENERRLRRFYRVILNVAGVYYYLSLPIVLILVLLVCGGIVYGFLLIGRIPIKLTILLIIGAVMTIVAMVRSLFIKPSAEEPGRVLERREAPELWALAEEVARDVGTRPIDEIRVTPGTELAVYERGNWRVKLQDKGERILVLGTGVLNGFKVNHFRSVLAHEYGHFSNRDTAGGEVALRVHNDIVKFYLAMCQAGQATWYNLAFQFLRFYHFLFRRISHGATRLQEILADRVAAQAYGPVAFEGGLTHVVRRSIEFDQIASREIQEVLKSRQALQRMYDAEAADATTVEDDFKKLMERETTDDDTHPSPRDRFRLIAGVKVQKCPDRPGELWELFVDQAALKRDMLARIEQQIAAYRS
jgi:Zn-dependent protease with chaperone function